MRIDGETQAWVPRHGAWMHEAAGDEGTAYTTLDQVLTTLPVDERSPRCQRAIAYFPQATPGGW